MTVLKKEKSIHPVRVLVECSEMIASVQVGVLDTLAPLVEQGVVCTRFLPTREIKREDMAWCDVLICVRGGDKLSVEALRAARKAQRRTIYFLDDDLLNVPEGLSCSGFYQSDRTKKAIQDCIHLADVLWCVNPLVAERYRVYCPGMTVLCPSPTQLPQNTPISSGPAKLLYAGSADHEKSLQKYLSPILPTLCESHTSEFEILFLGANPGIEGYKQIQYQPYIDDLDRYRHQVLQGGYNLGLAVLEQGSFFNCKYISKYFEYTRMGIVGIYSNTMPYTQVIRDGYNGLLCDNTPENWRLALERAIGLSPEERMKMLMAAQTDIRTKFSPQVCAGRLQAVLSDILDSAPVCSAKEIKMPDMKYLFILDRLKALWEENPFTFFPKCAGRVVRRIKKTLLRSYGL